MTKQIDGVSTSPGDGNRDAPRPRPGWASLEVILAFVIALGPLALATAGFDLPTVLFGLGTVPWSVAVAALFLRWRGLGWRTIGLGRPTSLRGTLAVGVLVGVSYQFVGTYAIEPLIARLTSGALPDVSQFRPLIGDERQLAYWVGMSWTVAAILEEVSFRGWLMTRVAEIGRYDRHWWIASLLASSALFGAVHVYQGLSGIIATALTGFVFGGLYLATGRNLWACVIAHGTLDTIGFTMMYFGVYPGI
jgi:membrane protease YdiL (CAAX protease family)